MPLTSDWHIHSHNSCDGACMAVSTLIARAREKGIRDFGLTDHLHTRLTIADVARSRREFRLLCDDPRFHFGIEVSCISQWELDEIAAGRARDKSYGIRKGGPAGATPAISLTEADMEELGIEYVVGGTHWPLYAPEEREAIIRDYHRQNMFLACHPLVDIVAHPWWWMGAWKDADGRQTGDPWLDDFRKVPQAMHDEFAAAAIEHGAVIEANLGAMLLTKRYNDPFKRQYLDYLAGLKARGATLSLASDCHDATYEADFETAERMLASVGLRDEDFWRLPPRE